MAITFDGDADNHTLAGALAGAGLGFMYAQQKVMAKQAEELSRCNPNDRADFRRCQTDMLCALKPMLILAAEAAVPEVRKQCVEALTQTAMNNVELATLIANSGLFGKVIADALKSTSSGMSVSTDFIPGLELTLIVAKAAPEASVHVEIIPHIAQLLQGGVATELDTRHFCVEILTYLSYTRHRCRDVAVVLTSDIVTFLLREEDGTEQPLDITREASQGKVLLSEALESPYHRQSISSFKGVDFSDSMMELQKNCRRTSFSASMRHFSEIVRRSSVGQTERRGDMWQHNVNGHHFYIALLMANLSEFTIPGTSRCFGDVAEPFWKRIFFYPGLGMCLGATLQGEPWPPLSDGEHRPLNVVTTIVKLVQAGYSSKLIHVVESLAAAIQQGFADEGRDVTVSQQRIARLSAWALQDIVWKSKAAKVAFIACVHQQDGNRLVDAINALVREEPAAGNLADVIAEEMSNPRCQNDDARRGMARRASNRSCSFEDEDISEGCSEEHQDRDEPSSSFAINT